MCGQAKRQMDGQRIVVDFRILRIGGGMGGGVGEAVRVGGCLEFETSIIFIKSSS